MAAKLTKYQPEKMKEDIILAENNNQIFLNGRENMFLKLHTNKSYIRSENRAGLNHPVIYH